ncbi:hypothetical protein LguiB_018035 [Lonicera macranthoides]
MIKYLLVEMVFRILLPLVLICEAFAMVIDLKFWDMMRRVWISCIANRFENAFRLWEMNFEGSNRNLGPLSPCIEQGLSSISLGSGGRLVGLLKIRFEADVCFDKLQERKVKGKERKIGRMDFPRIALWELISSLIVSSEQECCFQLTKVISTEQDTSKFTKAYMREDRRLRAGHLQVRVQV